MPKGALAPGKVLPKFWVPTNGFTRSTGSTAAPAAVPPVTRTAAASSAVEAISRGIREATVLPPGQRRKTLVTSLSHEVK
jgi:hypothetical protein